MSVTSAWFLTDVLKEVLHTVRRFRASAENIVEAALCKSVLKPLREPIYQSLEKLHTEDGSLKQLTDNQVRNQSQEHILHQMSSFAPRHPGKR